MQNTNLPVQCGTCKKTYPYALGVDAPNQGLDCASYMTETSVVGCYGSRLYDGEEWLWTSEKPADVASGNLCDTCIQSLIQKGLLKLHRTNVW